MRENKSCNCVWLVIFSSISWKKGRGSIPDQGEKRNKCLHHLLKLKGKNRLIHLCLSIRWFYDAKLSLDFLWFWFLQISFLQPLYHKVTLFHWKHNLYSIKLQIIIFIIHKSRMDFCVPWLPQGQWVGWSPHKWVGCPYLSWAGLQGRRWGRVQAAPTTHTHYMHVSSPISNIAHHQL